MNEKNLTVGMKVSFIESMAPWGIEVLEGHILHVNELIGLVVIETRYGVRKNLHCIDVFSDKVSALRTVCQRVKQICERIEQELYKEVAV